MVKYEKDYQKPAVGKVQPLMLPREHTTYAELEARQRQQQKIRNVDALARARSVARHTQNH
jgi:hypothetical protein